MTFTESFNRIQLDEWVAHSLAVTRDQVARLLQRSEGPDASLADFAALISPAGGGMLEELATRSRRLTRQRFGKVIRLFAPLYLSNECINNCAYCGFSRDNAILRVTLTVEDVVREATSLRAQGFRSLLLVAGEHPRFISEGYLRDCVAAVRDIMPSISLEVGPLETEAYRPMVDAGAEGLVVYQETYDRAIYGKVHTLGPKKDFDWRLETAERAYAAGFRRLGVGVLFGLSDWRREALALAAHALWLMRHCWKAQLTVSLPRLRPCAGEFEPYTRLEDRELLQLICAFRLVLPDVGLVLSTREPQSLRDGLVSLGITHMSAGSHTEPGGYTGAGSQRVHYTRGGRMQAGSEADALPAEAGSTRAAGQFEIADQRAPRDVAAMVERVGLEPVWKDWDAAVSGSH